MLDLVYTAEWINRGQGAGDGDGAVGINMEGCYTFV